MSIKSEELQGIPRQDGLAFHVVKDGRTHRLDISNLGTLLSGEGAPDGEGTGIDGDFYLDTAAKAIYGPKTGGDWGDGVSLLPQPLDTSDAPTFGGLTLAALTGPGLLEINAGEAVTASLGASLQVRATNSGATALEWVSSTGTGNLLRQTALTAGGLNWSTTGNLSVGAASTNDALVVAKDPGSTDWGGISILSAADDTYGVSMGVQSGVGFIRPRQTGVGGLPFWIEAATTLYTNGSGRVGIGSSSPAQKLHVSTNSTSSVDIARFQNLGSTGDSYLDIGVGYSGNFDDYVVFKRNGTYVFGITSSNAIDIQQVMSVSSNKSMQSTVNANNSINLSDAGANFKISWLNNLIFLSSGSEKARFDVNGSLGIGTSSPSALLSVGSSSQFQVNSSGAIAAATGITTSGGIAVTGNSTIAGTLSSLTGLTSSGTVTFPASITLASNTFTRAGAHNLTLTTGATTNVTLPASGTLYGTASGSITSSQLATSLTDETGTGSVVFSASPTLTGTPVIPASITMGSNTFARSGAHSLTLTTGATTNVTLPASGTLYGTASGSITSSQLATSLTDETGSGSLVFSASPTLTGTPVIPASITMGSNTFARSGAHSLTLTTGAITNVTLPASGMLYGTASGSITSSQLATSLTDETGSGSLVFSASPTLSGTIGGSLTWSGGQTMQSTLSVEGDTDTLADFTAGYLDYEERLLSVLVEGPDGYGPAAVIGTAANEARLLVHGTAEISGNLSVEGGMALGSSLSVASGLTVSSGGISVTGNSTIAGTLSSLTGLTLASGTVTLTALTADRLVSTNGSKGLASGITAANLRSSVTGTTGSGGDLVFATGPTLTTLTVSSGGMAVTGNSTIAGTLSSLTGLTSSGTVTFPASITLASNTLTRAGAHNLTLTTAATTDVTLPASGTLYGTATGSITSSQLATSLTDETGTGNVVFSASPTLTGTPVIPASITMGSNTFARSGAHSLTLTTGAVTNVTLPASGTLYGTASDSITSSQFATSLTDETGTGSVVFSASPTLTGTPVIPASITMGSNTFARSGAHSLTLTTGAITNVTLPASGTLYGTATGSITSSQLATSLTDETGTGSVVFATGPTLTTLTVSSGGVTVTGNSTITGTLSSLTGLTSSGTITFSGLSGTGTRLVTGTSGGQLGNATTIAGAYTFSDAMALQSALSVEGEADVLADFTAGYLDYEERLLSVLTEGPDGYGPAAVIGTVANEARLLVHGMAEISGNLSVEGGMSLGSSLSVASGGISVTGNSTIAGTLSSLTGLTSSGTVTFPASITLASNTFTRAGAHNLTLTTGATTNVTLPASGTLYGTASGSITSSQLATSLTDETGTGSVVFSASPTLTGTPVIPASITMGSNTFARSGAHSLTLTTGAITNVTLPASGTLYGTASGSITSSQLATSLTDETGSGSLVFSASPTLSGTIGGSLTWSGGQTMQSTLSVEGDTDTLADFTAGYLDYEERLLSVLVEGPDGYGPAAVIGTAANEARLLVHGTAEISGNLSVEGGMALGSSLSVASGLTVSSGGISVTGNSTIAGTLSSLTGLTSSGTVTFPASITLASNTLTRSGAHNLTLTTGATTDVTLPASGTLYGTASGSITSSQLATSLSDETGTGSVVFSASPTLTGTPVIPASITMASNTFARSGAHNLTLTTGATTNVTLPASGTLYGTASGSITSSQLATSLTDETGSGSAVFATSPTLTTLTVSSGGVAVTGNSTIAGTLSSLTGLTSSGTVTFPASITMGSNTLTRSGAHNLTLTTGATTNVTLPASGTLYGTASGSITSSQLATSLTDETGSGSAVFATSPTLTTLTVSSGGVAVTGNSTITGTLSSLTGVTSSGTITFSGLAGTGTRLVTGTSGGQLGNATTIAGAYTFSEAMALQSTLSVVDNFTAGHLDYDENLLSVLVEGPDGYGPAAVIGTVANEARLLVHGMAEISGNLSVEGGMSLGSSLSVASGLTVSSGGISVTGNSTIAGTLSSLTGLTSSGTVTFPASITLASNTLTRSGAHNLTLTTGATTNVTLPASGTLYGTATGSITSSQLATSLTDETGSGSAVFATSPTLTTLTVSSGGVAVTGNSTITGTLSSLMGLTSSGTVTFPASITLASNTLTRSGAHNLTLTTGATTNVTLPASGTLYGTASGSITSSQLATSLTDETGSGSAVFSASPTLSGTIGGSLTWSDGQVMQSTLSVVDNFTAGYLDYDENLLSVLLDGPDGYGPAAVVGASGNEARLFVYGATELHGDLSVDGGVSLGSSLSVASSLSVSSGINVTGNSTINGTLSSLTGLTVSSGGITVTGNSTIAGTLSSLTGLTSSGTVTFPASITLASNTLTRAGAHNLTLTTGATTNVTLPASGTLYGTASGSITSSQLATSLTDETGTGSVVFSASPTLTGTPVIPAGITMGSNTFARSGAHNLTLTTGATTNVTLPASGTLYGTASGSITSSQLATSLTDETGSGSAVFSASPTLSGTIGGALAWSGAQTMQSTLTVADDLTAGFLDYDEKVMTVTAAGYGVIPDDGPGVVIGGDSQEAMLLVRGGIFAQRADQEETALETGVGRVRFGDKVFMAASNSNRASLNIMPGDPPDYPEDGDVWVTGTTAYIQLAGTAIAFADVYGY